MIKLCIFEIPVKPFDVKVLRDLLIIHESPELSCVDSDIFSHMNLLVSVGYLAFCLNNHPILDIVLMIEKDCKCSHLFLYTLIIVASIMMIHVPKIPHHPKKWNIDAMLANMTSNDRNENNNSLMIRRLRIQFYKHSMCYNTYHCTLFLCDQM